MNVAIILAGGNGTRFGDIHPKQFFQIEEKTILEYAIDAFEINSGINEIAVVTQPDYFTKVETLISSNHYKKVNCILPGGKERYQSSLSAIDFYSDNDLNLFIHDAVRPMVSQRIINDCIEAMKTYRVVNVALPATDTIIKSDPTQKYMIAAPDRRVLMYGQSPQCFKRGIIKKAYIRALEDPNFRTTDDCGIVCKYLPEERIGIVIGEPTNMKITYGEDISTLQILQRIRREQI